MAAPEKLPEIRKFDIPNRGSVFKPTPQDPDSGIRDAIAQGDVVFESDRFRLVAVPAPSPHSVGYSIVYWADEKNSHDTPHRWGDDSWERVSQDAGFLSGLENHIRVQRITDPTARSYLFVGYVRPGTEVPGIVYKRGLQTQEPMHAHFVEAYNLNSDHNGFLDPSIDKERGHLNVFLNQAGEVSIGLLEKHLINFGIPLVYRQTIGIENRQILPRTMFGFSSLQSALQSTLELRRCVYGTWFEHALAVTAYKHEFSGLVLGLMQTAVPSFFIIIPSDDDRKNGNVTGDSKIWVMPFAVFGGQGVLTEGGGVTNRFSPSEKKLDH